MINIDVAITVPKKNLIEFENRVIGLMEELSYTATDSVVSNLAILGLQTFICGGCKIKTLYPKPVDLEELNKFINNTYDLFDSFSVVNIVDTEEIEASKRFLFVDGGIIIQEPKIEWENVEYRSPLDTEKRML